VAAAPQLWLMLLLELQLLLQGLGVVVSPLWLVQHLQGAQSCRRPQRETHGAWRQPQHQTEAVQKQQLQLQQMPPQPVCQQAPTVQHCGVKGQQVTGLLLGSCEPASSSCCHSVA